jgi:hypothetical protein
MGSGSSKECPTECPKCGADLTGEVNNKNQTVEGNGNGQVNNKTLTKTVKKNGNGNVIGSKNLNHEGGRKKNNKKTKKIKKTKKNKKIKKIKKIKKTKK